MPKTTPKFSPERVSSRESLRRLARAATAGLVTVADAATALEATSREAANRLAYLAHRGWLRRVKRGLYLVIPLEAGGPSASRIDDPWILATRLFAPCYIGGWSAAEHWELTEQIFRETFVVSAKRLRRRDVRLPAAEFRVVRSSIRRVTAAQPLWRGKERVPVSDREQTLADGLANPEWVGGVRHLADMLRTYREGSTWSSTKLLAAVSAVESGAAYKRLGFLTEALRLGTDEVLRVARERKRAGIVRLDPKVRGRGRLNKGWGLWVNVGISPGEPG